VAKKTDETAIASKSPFIADFEQYYKHTLKNSKQKEEEHLLAEDSQFHRRLVRSLFKKHQNETSPDRTQELISQAFRALRQLNKNYAVIGPWDKLLAKQFQEPEEEIKLQEGATLIATFEYENVDFSPIQTELQTISDKVKDAIAKARAIETMDKLKIVNQILFHELKFKMNNERTDSLFINQALRSQQGSSAIMATIFYAISQANGINLKVIGGSSLYYPFDEFEKEEGGYVGILIDFVRNPLAWKHATKVVDSSFYSSCPTVYFNMILNLLNVSKVERDTEKLLYWMPHYQLLKNWIKQWNKRIKKGDKR